MADERHRILFLVPARGGSRRVPGKNLRTVAGIPLVGHAIRLARAVAATTDGGPHVVLCSTDDPDIAAAAATWGAEVLERPAELAADDSSSLDVALHALDATSAGGDSFGTLVLLQPTSPLTSRTDLRSAIERHREAGGSVTSVTRSHHVGWHLALGSDGTLRALEQGGSTPADDAVLLTGGFYVIAPGELRETRTFVTPDRTIGVVVPAERAVDVDTEADLVAAEAFAAARPITPVEIAGHGLGGGPAFVIAEAGVNHNGDLELARRLVDAAADTGADAVKFQTFDPADLAAPGAPQAEYQAERGRAADQREMLAALTLPEDAWSELQERARDRNLLFLSTPFDDGSAEVLDRLGVPAFKVGSGELTNLGFLARIARRGRPMLVSTGMADIAEVAAALDTIESAGDPPVALLHCVSAYPASIADANLRAIETMRRAFGVPVGWSDHTPGTEAALTAVALGASIVEKHLTLDRTLPGPDHAASLEPAEFGAMVVAIRAVESALGDGAKVPAAAEIAMAAVSRRSLHWARPLASGDHVTDADLVALRPGTGIPPAQQGRLIGRVATRDVAAGDAVRPEDVGDGP